MEEEEEQQQLFFKQGAHGHTLGPCVCWYVPCQHLLDLEFVLIEMSAAVSTFSVDMCDLSPCVSGV